MRYLFTRENLIVACGSIQYAAAYAHAAYDVFQVELHSLGT